MKKKKAKRVTSDGPPLNPLDGKLRSNYIAKANNVIRERGIRSTTYVHPDFVKE